MLNRFLDRTLLATLTIFFSLTLLGQGFVSNVDSLGMDSLIYHRLSPNYFDPGLIPCRDLYGDNWDSTNVDSFMFDPRTMPDEVTLDLVDSSCGYTHPFYGLITSRFGYRWSRMHKGIDIDLVTGDKVVAAFDGVVRISRYNYGGFGHYVLIRHYNGLETIYGHLSKRLVKVNQSVKSGEVIGLGGNTGRSTGSHLHFETRYIGKAFDPEYIIDFKEGKLKSPTIVIKKSWFLYITSPYDYQKKYAKYHTIKSGDTLSHIARKYGTSVSALCRLNGINRNTILRVGRTIRVR